MELRLQSAWINGLGPAHFSNGAAALAAKVDAVGVEDGGRAVVIGHDGADGALGVKITGHDAVPY